jgi:hypothetical protein
MSPSLPEPLSAFGSVPADAFSPALALVLARICTAVYLPSADWNDDTTVHALQSQAPIENPDDAHCLIGDVPGTNITVLAFRGTGPISTKNWLADSDFPLVSIDDDGESKVHQGFLATFRSLPRLQDRLPRQRMLWITGHSLGGALATLACRQLQADSFPVQATYTFGGPRVGNAAFAASLPAPLYRFVLGDDIVPHLPPRDVYQHGGVEVSLTSEGTLTRADQPGDGGDDGFPTLASLVRFTTDLAGGDTPVGNLLSGVTEVVADPEPAAGGLVSNPQQLFDGFFDNRLFDTLLKGVTHGQDAALLEEAAERFSPLFVPRIRDHFPGRYVDALERAQQ